MSFEIIAEGRNGKQAYWDGERYGERKTFESQIDAERAFKYAIRTRSGGLIKSITLYETLIGSRGEILSRQPLTSKKF